MLVVLAISLFLGIVIMPIAIGKPIEVKENNNNALSIRPPKHSAFFIGKIYNLTIEGDNYSFESNSIRTIHFDKYSFRSWRFSIEHLTGSFSCYMGNAEFCGIIKPNFICGIFY